MSKIGAVLGVVGIVLAIVGFVGPWWTVGISASAFGSTVTGNADFRLFGGTGTTTVPGAGTITNTTDYSDQPNTRSVFLVGAALSGVAIALGAGLVGLGMMAEKNPSRRKIASVCGILAGALALVGLLYVMAALPGAVNTDGGEELGQFTQISGFWGTDSMSLFGVSATVTWGAGWAWYVVLVGAIVFLIGGVLAMRAPKAAAMAPPMTETPPESPPMP